VRHTHRCITDGETSLSPGNGYQRRTINSDTISSVFVENYPKYDSIATSRREQPIKQQTGKWVPVNKNERIKMIVNRLRQKNAVTIKELTSALEVSEMTIRRDLSLLEADDVIEIIPGGAILKPHEEPDGERYLIDHEETRKTREKVKIGKKAASLIVPNDTIILDVGSTTEYIAKFIRDDLPVTILCYSLNILVDVYRKKGSNPIFAGGYFHKDTLMFVSQEGTALVKKTRADKSFISAAGFHETLGVTTVYPYEIETKKAAISSSNTRILVMDSSKFGVTKAAHFAEIEEFDIVITDSALGEKYRRIVGEAGIELILV
jgi:DeoR family deoxyribose operon repressor